MRTTLLTLSTLTAIGAGALSAAPDAVPVHGAVEGGPSIVLSNADGQSVYDGIVRYQGRATCTGVFLQTAFTVDEGHRTPAYVLTNGHCADFPGANQVLIDRPATGHRVVFNYFVDTPADRRTVTVRRIVYATMKGIDLALLELDARFGDLVDQGYQPWRLARVPGPSTEPAVVVGAPQGASASASFLRLASCREEGIASNVLEFTWHWFDAGRNRCADIRPGSSGSPVISRGTGRVLALVNSTTAGAVPFTDCFLDHPCEASPGSTAGRADTNYASGVWSLAGCFESDGVFDLARAGCGLDPDRQLTPSPQRVGPVNPDLTSVPLGQPQSRWNVRLAGPWPYYRYKVVAADADDCRHPSGYSAVQRLSDRPSIDDPLPRVDGPYYLCIIAGADARGVSWQRAQHATVVVAVVDRVPPQAPAPLAIVREQASSYRVTFNGLGYEIAGYQFKFGRPADTNCGDDSGYRVALLPFISISTAQGPQAFCAVPFDAAGNRAPPIERLLL